MNQRIVEERIHNEVLREWQFAARVLDKILLWIFSVFVVSATLTTLFAVPNIADAFAIWTAIEQYAVLFACGSFKIDIEVLLNCWLRRIRISINFKVGKIEFILPAVGYVQYIYRNTALDHCSTFKSNARDFVFSGLFLAFGRLLLYRVAVVICNFANLIAVCKKKTLPQKRMQICGWRNSMYFCIRNSYLTISNSWKLII